MSLTFLKYFVSRETLPFQIVTISILLSNCGIVYSQNIGFSTNIPSYQTNTPYGFTQSPYITPYEQLLLQLGVPQNQPIYDSNNYANLGQFIVPQNNVPSKRKKKNQSVTKPISTKSKNESDLTSSNSSEILDLESKIIDDDKKVDDSRACEVSSGF